MRKAIKVGLTGTTGAGKSTVANELKKYGFGIINADEVAKLATEKGAPLLLKLSEAFGEDVINEDGTLNRKLLAERAFATPEATSLLNKTTHPEIVRMIEKKINGAFWDGYEAVVIDAPQLFESRMSYDCGFIISVLAPKDIRKKRIMERDALTDEEAERRISAQLSDDFFRQKSDVIIENDGNIEHLKEQVLYAARLIEQKISGEITLDI